MDWQNMRSEAYSRRNIHLTNSFSDYSMWLDYMKTNCCVSIASDFLSVSRIKFFLMRSIYCYIYRKHIIWWGGNIQTLRTASRWISFHHLLMRWGPVSALFRLYLFTCFYTARCVLGAANRTPFGSPPVLFKCGTTLFSSQTAGSAVTWFNIQSYVPNKANVQICITATIGAWNIICPLNQFICLMANARAPAEVNSDHLRPVFYKE